MFAQYNNTPLTRICEGCLSVDRKLSTIYDVEYRRIFLELLESMDHVNQDIILCWECTAIVRSVIQFKKQVKKAHDCLVRYMVPIFSDLRCAFSVSMSGTGLFLTDFKKSEGGGYIHIDCYCEGSQADQLECLNKFTITMVCQSTDLTSLSTLTKSVTNVTEDYYQNAAKDDKSFITTSSFSEITNSEMSCNNQLIKVPSDSEFELKTTSFTASDAGASGNDTQPIFVKIEDNDFDFVESFYENENDKCLDKEKIESKPTQENVVKKSKSKKRKRKKVEYDASDDEPLKPGKNERQGRPKKTETEEKTVQKRRKKEKPAGVVTNSRVNRNLEQLNVMDGQIEMVVLSWEEVEMERQKALSSEVFTRHEYRCYDCVLGFNHRFKLDNHMTKHDPAAGPAECPVCRVRCRDDHALVAHKRRHRVRWRCVSCGAAASRAAVAADHAARAHGAAATHTCRRCGDTHQSLAKLRNHMKNHAERQKCELCGKTFRDRTSLRTHLFIHRGEKEYSCTHCDKKFLFKKAMEVHLVTHSAPAQLYCLECDMTFKNRMSYYQHKKYNLKHIDPAKLKYQCPLCDKKFLKAVRLEEHNFAVHLKVTPIRCTMQGCDFACSSRPVLRTHIRMVHRNVRAVRNHVCDTCGKAYTTKKTLEGHMRSHTGERPFHCTLCPSTFSYEAALYNHNKLVHLKGKTNRRQAPDWPTVDPPNTSS